MRRWLRVLLALTAGLFILAGITIAALIGLNAECNGADCPRSDAWRGTVVATPLATAILLLVGATWSAITRKLRPLVLAEAAVLAVVALVDAALSEPDVGTGVLLAVAGLVGWLALRRGSDRT
jgi:hypothetical protein